MVPGAWSCVPGYRDAGSPGFEDVPPGRQDYHQRCPAWHGSIAMSQGSSSRGRSRRGSGAVDAERFAKEGGSPRWAIRSWGCRWSPGRPGPPGHASRHRRSPPAWPIKALRRWSANHWALACSTDTFRFRTWSSSATAGDASSGPEPRDGRKPAGKTGAQRLSARNRDVPVTAGDLLEPAVFCP
jgi:hypothetical protein